MRRPIVRYGPHGAEETTDSLVVESPVEFVLGGVPIAVLMRTPGDDEELGLGFAITEGIVLGPDEIVGVTPTGSTFAPSSALTRLVLPWLNSPTTTR